VKVLFAHDHHFVRQPDGIVVSPGQFDTKILGRYLEAFDEMTVFSRMTEAGPDFNGSGHLRCSRDGVEFVAAPNLSSLEALIFGRFEIDRQLRGLLEKHDAVIARLPSEIGIAAVRVAQNVKRPTAVEVVGCAFDALKRHSNWQGRLYAPIAMARMRHAVGMADQVLYVTDRFLQRRYPSTAPQAAVSNVDIPEPPNSCLETRFENIAGARPLKAGMIANVAHRTKGLDIALRALRIVRDADIDMTLEIVGPGGDHLWRDLIESLDLSKHVVFRGVLPRGAEILAFLDDIDIYLQPSFQEGLPRAVIEAMSRGCPVLGSNAGGTPELLPERFIHRAGDYTILAEQWLQLAQTPQLRSEAAKTNFVAAQRFYASRLDKVRRQFWKSFAERIR